MRLYYLNPNITAEGLKKLDTAADGHTRVCREAIASMMPELDDCEAVRKAKASMMVAVVQSMITFG